MAPPGRVRGLPRRGRAAEVPGRRSAQAAPGAHVDGPDATVVAVADRSDTF